MDRSDNSSVSLGTFIVASACATLGMMTSLSFLVFHVYHRHNKIVKMCSPYMNMITGLGAILLCVVCFLFGTDFLLQGRLHVQSALCQVRHWLTVHGLTLMFAPIAVKAWRVYSIFKYAFAKKVVIKDLKLVGIIVVLSAVDAILMTSWQTIEPVKMEQRVFLDTNLDELNPNVSCASEAKLLIECTCQKYPVWLTVHALWKLALLFPCLYFNWKTRTVSVPCLNDCSLTFAAVFVNAVVIFCAAIVVTSVRGQQDAVHIILSIAISACVILLQLVLFLPRMRYWWKTPDDVALKITSVSRSGSTGESPEPEMSQFEAVDLNANMCGNEGGFLEVVKENKALKNSLTQKEKQLAELRSLLKSPKAEHSGQPAEVENKQDSGLEADVSSGSHELHDDVIETVTSDKTPVRSRLYKVEACSQVDRLKDEETFGINFPYIESSSQESNGSAHSFINDFTDLRQSARGNHESEGGCVENNSHSVAIDVEKTLSNIDWIYQSRNNQDLAGSIAQSLNMEDDNEVMTYISSCLDPPFLQLQKPRRRSSTFSNPASNEISDNPMAADDISIDMPPLSRGSSTPNSQQHAAILRYYTYQHDRFKRFAKYRGNSDLLPKKIRPKPKPSRQTSRQLNNSCRSAATNAPKVVTVPRKVIQNGDCSDSFV